jgi:hypothetical protein
LSDLSNDNLLPCKLKDVLEKQSSDLRHFDFELFHSNGLLLANFNAGLTSKAILYIYRGGFFPLHFKDPYRADLCAFFTPFALFGIYRDPISHSNASPFRFCSYDLNCIQFNIKMKMGQ